MPELLLGLDVGTTSIGAGLFTLDGRKLAWSSRRLKTNSPAPGRLEQDASAIWRAALAVMRGALADAWRDTDDLAAIGITTQRTSLVVWDRRDGRPRTPLVLWSDLRGVERAAALRSDGYFVAPQQAVAKLEAAISSAGDGDLAWGNIDSYLIWRLSGGAAHVTDRSQAWPTGYLDLSTMGWNQGLIGHQGLDAAMFPRLVDTWGVIAETAPTVLGRAVPITADIADQQAALIAHGGQPGAAKVTYGTSATLDLATGAELVLKDFSAPPFVVSAVAGEARFCIEGMVYTAGAALDWMRGTMRLGAPPAFDRLAAGDAGGVWFLPALQGLGAPHGDAARRGVLGGLSLGATRAQIARAGLEGVAFRTREVFEHVHALAGRAPPPALGVDGGLAGSNIFLQLQADLLGHPLRLHALGEATACGAAICAARGAGLIGADETGGLVAYDRTFGPAVSRDEADGRFDAWKTAAYGAPPG